MNQRVLAALFLMAALAGPVILPMPTVAQNERRDKNRGQEQQSEQEQNRFQEQQHQLWNGDYRFEDTVDREWLKEHRHFGQPSHRYHPWDADYRYEETVDRNWLNGHNID